MLKRCSWAENDTLMMAYHDKEWGVPIHDDRRLFEFLILEGAQAGLSWQTILRRRDNYHAAFDNFDAEKIVRYTPAKIQKLLNNPGIIRNQLKIAATIANAKAFLAVQKQFGHFADYIWQFVEGVPKQNRWRTREEVPALSPESQAMSKDLQRRGFKFVGSTICYAYMQAVGMVNDHLITCFRYKMV
ncbi:MAG: DNA-3-methyladenine glycosylase I [Gammaproteobacteria bacterium]